MRRRLQVAPPGTGPPRDHRTWPGQRPVPRGAPTTRHSAL